MVMARIVLSTDETLTSTYHDVPLLDFLGCAPVDKLPNWVFRILDSQTPDNILRETVKISWASPLGNYKPQRSFPTSFELK